MFTVEDLTTIRNALHTDEAKAAWERVAPALHARLLDTIAITPAMIVEARAVGANGFLVRDQADPRRNGCYGFDGHRFPMSSSAPQCACGAPSCDVCHP